MATSISPIATSVAVTCPYCQQPAELVNGYQIYRHRPDLHRKMFWRCDPCAAYVGCHEGSVRPLGRLANAELRSAKADAHRAFDPLWTTGQMSRRNAYRLLADRLGLSPGNCHIGMFDVEMCRRAVEVITGDDARRKC